MTGLVTANQGEDEQMVEANTVIQDEKDRTALPNGEDTVLKGTKDGNKEDLQLGASCKPQRFAGGAPIADMGHNSSSDIQRNGASELKTSGQKLVRKL